MSTSRISPNALLVGVFGGLVAAILFIGGAIVFTGGADSTTTPAAASVPDDTAAEGGTPAVDEVDEVVDGDPGVAAPGEHGNDWTEGGGEGGSTDLDPATPEVDPCDTIADPDQQFVAPTVVELESGEFSGQLQILNCTSGLLDVELDGTNGLDFVAGELALPPGISTVDFEIDEDTVNVGAFELKFKVTQTGCCADYGDVIGFRQGFNPDFVVPGLGLTAGAGQGGCKAGCIKTVWVEGNQLHTSVELTVGTNVAADIDVRISTQAPVPNQVGDPSMPGVAPVLSANSPAKELTGTLVGLEATTTYFILVTATDSNGTSTFSDSFTTVDPVDHAGDFAGNDPNPGCSAGCITHAVVDAIDHDSAHLLVNTSMAADMQVFVSTTPVDQSGAVPTIADPVFTHQTPEPFTVWHVDITSLDADTTFHVLVKATDANGKSDYQVGSFTTSPAPKQQVIISADRIDIKENGDLIGRGEIRFGFAYDSTVVGTRSEQKLKEGATVWPDAYNFAVVDLAPGEATRSFAVWAGERDVQLGGFCEAPLVGLDCGGINWNVAYSGGVTLADIADMPLCSNYGFTGDAAGDHCLKISDTGGIGDDVTFDAVIRYQVG